MGTFLEIACPKEQAQYRRAGLLWVIYPADPEDVYSECPCVNVADPVEFQEHMMQEGWKYAILIEDDEGGDD